MRGQGVRPKYLLSLVTKISEHPIPGLRVGPLPHVGAIIRPSMAWPYNLTRHQRRPKFSCSPAHALAGVYPFTALPKDLESLVAPLLAAPFIHTTSPETVIHRLETWDNQLASQAKRDAGLAGGISTGRPPSSLIAQSVHSVLNSIMDVSERGKSLALHQGMRSVFPR